ncbi:MAG: DUF494 family protein [Gemmatimonadaceae bacterium]
MDERWGRLLEDLKARFNSDSDVVEVEAYLSSQGYDGGQIGEILELLYSDTVSELPEMANAMESRTLPLRVQGPHERGRFSAEAWGYLIMLGGSGLVSQHDFEQLVERALLHVDGRIGLAEIRAIAEDGGFDDASTMSDRSLVH